MTISLVGITGNRGHGKDTSTRALVNDVLPPLRLRGQRDGFADRLKISAARALGYVEETPERCIAIMEAIKQDEGGHVASHAKTYSEMVADVQTHKDAHKVITGREFLQYYGTEAHRNIFGADFWIRQVIPDPSFPRTLGRADSHLWDVLVISDVRFPNEADEIKKAKGKVIRVVRPDLEVVDSHASEVPLPDELVDYTIINDDLSKLPYKVGKAWRKLNG